jgi:nuclease-like protein
MTGRSRGRANVDHIVVGPCGVVVIDTNNYHRNTSVLGRGGRVWIGKRLAKNVLKPLVYEAQSVSQAP